MSSERRCSCGTGADAVCVSVVVPAFNAERLLPEQLRALDGQVTDVAFEVVVADNGSTDTTAAVASSYPSDRPIRVARADGAQGAAHARNAGAGAGRGGLLLFCDADDVVDVHWVQAMHDAWVGGPVLLGGALDGEALNPPAVLAWRTPLQRDGLPTGYQFLPYVLSSNLGCDADVFASLGGFDEKLTSRFLVEDPEFSFRAQLEGIEPTFVPDAVVQYRFRSGAWRSARQSFGYGRGVPHLYRRFRAAGFARPPLRRQLRQYKSLLRTSVRQLTHDSTRGAWLTKAGYLAGRAYGSFSARVVFW